ncbi:ATP-binding protein [Desulfogranum japonicum]|uniref:ATP-binding protein n=1 Tax=Desulfogranum japonicum TaxID=231447 RepID=UPI00048A4D97|nr:ATP-binding protein [Desulfogranum japonicum]
MNELVIVSGKGGTGKTSLTAAFSALAKGTVLCDADVDAADMHLLMQPKICQTTDFMGGGQACVDPQVCTQCGTCRDVCRFGAIDETFTVQPILCEGCGVCVDMCPEKAIGFEPQKCGEWYLSDCKYGPMVHARLGIAEENSGKLVSLVRKEARNLAEQKGYGLILTDGPPGIGCPVIASLSGATALLIVVEPTVSGIHDMLRVAELASHFKLPGMLCINKFDLNPEMSDKIADIGQKHNMPVVGRIPFDSSFVQAMVAGQNIFEYQPESQLSKTIQKIWTQIIGSPAMNSMGVLDLQSTIR